MNNGAEINRVRRGVWDGGGMLEKPTRISAGIAAKDHRPHLRASQPLEPELQEGIVDVPDVFTAVDHIFFHQALEGAFQG